MGKFIQQRDEASFCPEKGNLQRVMNEKLTVGLESIVQIGGAGFELDEL